MTVNDAREADIAAAQAELGRLMAPHSVTEAEIAGHVVAAPHAAAPSAPVAAPPVEVEQVSLLQLPGETPAEFRRRVPEVAGPQTIPDGFLTGDLAV